jgi:transposase
MNAISVGIDVSKGQSMVAAIRFPGETVWKPRKVMHTAAALETLAYEIKGLGYNGGAEVRVVMEATGRYYEPVANELHEVGNFVSVINPKLIKDYGHNTLRKVKTDKADARKIARYGLEYWSKLREYTPVEAGRAKLKQFSRQYNLYNKIKVQLTNNFIALLDQVFPGANELHDSPPKVDGRQKWVDFVTTFWHCECIADMSEVAFIERYRKWCKRLGYYFSETKAAYLYTCSLGHITTLPKNANTKLLVTEAAKQLTSISRIVEIFRAEMLRLAQMMPEYEVVMGLYGVGPTIGPQLMGEIGDVRDFVNRKQLIAFAGIDPGSDQSGKHCSESESTSKRGSALLRKCLYLAVETYVKKQPADEPVYQFYMKKRAEGKKYYVCTTAAANKFLRIYYARVKEHLDKAIPEEERFPCQG